MVDVGELVNVMYCGMSEVVVLCKWAVWLRQVGVEV